MKIKYRMIIVYFFAAILPLGMATFFYDYTSHRTLKENVSSLSQEILNQKKENINDRTLTIEKNLHMSASNQEILNIISTLPTSSVIERTTSSDIVRKYFNSILYNTRFLDTIILDIYDYGSLTFGEGKRDGFVADRIRYLTSDEFRDSDTYKLVQKNSYEASWFSNIYESNDKIYLMKEVTYFQYAKKLGVLIYVIDKAILTDGLTDNISDRSEEYALIDMHNNHYILGGTHHKLLDDVLLESDSEKAKTLTLDNNIVSYVDLVNDWKLVSIVPEKTIFADLIKTRKMTGMLILFGVILSFIAAWSISKMISKKVEHLIRRFEKVEKGDYSRYSGKIEQDEFGIIDTQFNSMVMKLDTVINENYLWKIETKEANLRALQYQINPHFLFNTLEVINSLANQKQQTEIRKVTQGLGKMFRYNLESEQPMTILKNEVEHVQTYLFLQQFQLTYPLQIIYDIAPETESAMVQKFMLQPLVENIIKHGFSDWVSEGYLEIQSEVDDDRLIVTVADDGHGMDEHRLLEVRGWLKASNQNKKEWSNENQIGIGLKNIQERIQLLYGDKYGLEIFSEKGKGMTVMIVIPLVYLKGEEK